MRYIAETDCLGDPIELYYKIADYIRSQVATEPKDYMIATQEEIRLEAQAVARSRGIVYNPYRADLEYPPTPAFAKAGAAPGTTAGVELFRAHSPLSLGHSRQLPPRPLAGSLCCSRVAACPLPAHPSRQLPPSPLAVSVPALQPALCLH